VIAGCVHAGIINTLGYDCHLSGQSQIRIVGNGFHLQTAGQRRIEKTASALDEMAIERFVSGHFTDSKAESYFRETL